MRYTFGTSQQAAQRLLAIAEFFNPLAGEFIRKYLGKQVNTAIDIGCGPGFTTEMLAKATAAKNIYGLDMSADFLCLAKEAFPGYQFLKHDVTQFPFPVCGEVIYARFLLAHLKEPCFLMNRWAGELAEKGLLFIEEVEEIFTDNPVFKKYLEINTDLVSSQGASLYAGREIKDGRFTHKIVSNEAVLLPVANRQAARWFYPNTITIWQQDEYLVNRLPEAERVMISGELKDIMESKEDEQGITWLMRRIVLERSV